MLAVDRVCAGHELTGGLAPHDVGGGGRHKLEGRVGLTALELLHRERPAKA